MNSTARSLCTALSISLVVAAAADAAESRKAGVDPSSYPDRPIRILVPFVGGVADVYARVIGHGLHEKWGQPVIIDNRPAAGGLVAAETAAKAAADGYTLLIGIDGTMTINPSLYSKLPYDPVKDFIPLSQVILAPLVLVVHPALPVKSVKQLIDLAKAKPGQLNYGSPATGNSGHLAGEAFRIMTGIDIVHVPYKGGAGALTALLGREVEMVFSNAGLAVPHVKAERLRGLAVSTSKRIPALPDLPTIAEAGVPGYEAATWTGIFARTGTPKPVFDKLEQEILRILRRPDIQENAINQGLVPVASTSEEFADYMKKEAAQYAKLIKTLGIRAE